MKTLIKVFLIILIFAVLGYRPIVIYGQEMVNGPPPTPLITQINAQAPPVEQPLIPEGVFAVQLVAVLKMGQIQDEAQAESMLSTIGIEPRNGWIAGYPVTPPVIGDIEKGVANAADAGNLRITKDEALKALGELKRNLGLNVSSGTVAAMAPQGSSGNTVIYKYIDKNGVIYYTDRYETIPKEYRNQTKRVRDVVQPQPSEEETLQENEALPSDNAVANANPEVINNYYYTEGPPIVTYYPPPDPYSYLYSWVPYPFRYAGFFFPGYFILHDFHRRIYYGNRLYAVTNHVANAAGKRMAIIEPVNRSLRGSIGANQVASSQGFGSPTAQTNARAIVGMNQNRMASAGGTAPRMSNVTPPTSLSRSQGPMRTNPPMRVAEFGGRTFSPPSISGMSASFVPPRVSTPPVVSRGQSFNAPSNVGKGATGGNRGGGRAGGHR